MAAKTMEELLAQSKTQIKSFRRGQKIEAKLLELGGSWATFDIGGKAEGMLADIYYNEAKDFLKTLKIGDTAQATVINPESTDGRVLLSFRNAANDSVWERLEELRKDGKVVSVKVYSVNDKGLNVDFEAISGFLPKTQIGKAKMAHYDKLEGTTLDVKIVEVNKERKNVLFSERLVSEKDEVEKLEKALNQIKEGEMYEGVVTQNTSFGSFVEIPVKNGKEETKVEGLVHISEISWEKVQDSSSVFKPGDKVKVQVLGFRDGKLALSAKGAKSDPWIEIGDKYQKEQKLAGTVTKQTDYGVFVQLEPGVEGLIHMTKVAPGTKFEKGQEVNVYIEEIDPKARKISLGMVLTAKPVNYR
jgi:small subunit ribosomal protein S1